MPEAIQTKEVKTMNSKQRRQAYRAMPKPGDVVQWRSASGKLKTGISEGPGSWDGEKVIKSTNRVRVRMESGAHFHPLVSRLVM